MGKLLSKIFGNKEMRILMLGLDAAGKTSILYNSCQFDNVLLSLRYSNFRPCVVLLCVSRRRFCAVNNLLRSVDVFLSFFFLPPANCFSYLGDSRFVFWSETEYFDSDVSWFSTVSPCKCCDNTLKKVTQTACRALPWSLFIFVVTSDTVELTNR